MKLNNDVAVVTGGGSGIGAAISRAFGQEGASVAVCDIDHQAANSVASDIRGAKGRARVWALDVADRESVEKTTDEIENELGPITIWVNNAGISRVVPFLDCTDDTWDRTLSVNLKGAFIGSQTAIRKMLPRKQGVVLNMSSQSGKAGNSHYAAYCASKFGIIGLTQSLAMEFAKNGIRVNALCPGVVDTPLWDEQLEDYARKRNMKPEEVRPYMESKIPMGRLCKPEEVAAVAVFLSSDAASYITGQAVNISGGSIMA